MAASRKALAYGPALLALIGASSALAQASTAPEAAQIEEVVVTAQRRSESLQSVPVTVTAFGADQVQQARIRQIDDVAGLTPGLQFDAFPASQPRISIRGIGSSDRGAAGDPSSAVFLDEIYLGRPAAVAFDAFDVERIEVLKGPQGTLFGRNVVGGAINVVSHRPDLDRFDAAAELTAGNYGRLEGAGVVNAPFADGKAAIRASGAWRTHDGFVKNTFTGGDVEDQDTRTGRLALRVEPREGVRLQASLDGARDRATGPAQHVLDLDASDPSSALWRVDRDRKHTAGSDDGYQDRDTWGVRLQADVDLSFAILTYLGSYRDLDYHAAYDFDGGNPTFNRAGISGGNDEASDFSSHELRLSSLPQSRVRWVAGLYAFNSQTDRRDSLVINLGRPGTEIYTQSAKLQSYAAFGDVTVPVSERVSLIGGLRYSKDDKDYRVDNLAGNTLFRARERFDVAVSDSYKAWTWRAGVDFKPAERHLIYAMASRGFKSGGFQDTPGSAADARDGFEPEFATQYEVGQKSSFLGGTLVWNNTLYVMKYADLQTRRTLPNLSVVTDNAGKATIKGYETYLAWRPFSGARLVASYGYTDARFDEFEPEPGVDYAGNRISRTPKHKLVLSPSYDLLLAGGGDVRFAVDYHYESMIFDDNANDGPERRDPTNFFDARALYTAPGDHWSVSLWGKNLTNEVTRTFQAVFLGANFGAYNPPRTFGVTLNWKH
ncbi:iron complex outermembrane receptor protein [Caulobacter rhizosphaerae]|uniref:Iron complex outermembrane receptor protein n=1 Tax=Caulobacter rhizosphaerae TaxID=2010972 RepID=A0ABU1MVJ6_9CAUL|nr:TonB-dependent receptor [Caulobacter rhizosphaerae]MDR6530213.1 iron complex outermembrane receptor protein [Caulobacter rhizosphaerae]